MTAGERLAALSGLAGVSAMVHFLAITAGPAAPAGAGVYVVTEQRHLFSTTRSWKVTKTAPTESRLVCPPDRLKPGDGTASDAPKDVWVREPAHAIAVLTSEELATVQVRQHALTVLRPSVAAVYTIGVEHG